MSEKTPRKPRRSMADLAAQVAQTPDASPAIVRTETGLTAVSVRDTAPPALQPAPAAPDIPDPYEALGEGGLSDAERVHLAACESALDTLRLAFARAGKALAVIRQARLYRETHPNFDAYCGDRWGMSRTQADRLIRAWPIAASLTPIGANDLNEAQVRELLPVSDAHGAEAAVVVYRTVAELDEVKVTAATIKAAVTAVPRDHWNEEEAVRLIRARLLEAEEAGADIDPETAAAAEFDRVRSVLQRGRFRTVLRAVPPARRRELVAEVRAILDELETEDAQEAERPAD